LIRDRFKSHPASDARLVHGCLGEFGVLYATTDQVLASHRLGLTNANRDLCPDLASTHVVPDQCELAQVKSLDVDHDC
jgi:hypothetical protein